MFDIGGTELLLVVALAVIFIGPRELPRVMRAIGAFARKARAVVSDFQHSFEDLANQADLEKLHHEAGETANAAKAAEPERPPAPDQDGKT